MKFTVEQFTKPNIPELTIPEKARTLLLPKIEAKFEATAEPIGNFLQDGVVSRNAWVGFNQLANDGLIEARTMANMLLILDEPPQLAKREKGLFKANYEEINKIGDSLVEQNVKLAVFDPLLAFYGGNENDNSEARVFIQSFATWANKAEITTVIIHHASKDGGSRGATAFHDGVRARYELDVPKDKDGNTIKDLMSKGFRVAKLKKDNWGIRKHLWRLTDGLDEITLKVAPTMKNDYAPEITEFVDENDFLKGIF